MISYLPISPVEELLKEWVIEGLMLLKKAHVLLTQSLTDTLHMGIWHTHTLHMGIWHRHITHGHLAHTNNHSVRSLSDLVKLGVNVANLNFYSSVSVVFFLQF